MALKPTNNGDRLRLYQENPNCYWCGKRTIFKPVHSPEYSGELRSDVATVDHLLTRCSNNRVQHDKRFVLACYKCNAERNENELKEKRPHCNTKKPKPRFTPAPPWYSMLPKWKIIYTLWQRCFRNTLKVVINKY